MRGAIHILFLSATFVFSPAYSSILQVATFNTGGGEAIKLDTVPCRKERLRSQVKELPMQLREPFVLLLQEVFTKDAAAAFIQMAQDHGYFVEHATSKTSGLMTISSEPIESFEFYPFGKDAFYLKRGVLEVVLPLTSGGLHVFNTHTDYGGPERPNPKHVAQLHKISEILGNTEGGSILGGDFNIGPDVQFPNQAYNPNEIVWRPFLESLLGRFGEAILPAGFFTRDEVHNPIIKYAPFWVKIQKGWRMSLQATLDHIFVSSNLDPPQSTGLIFNHHVKINGCPRDKDGLTALSDHYGVVSYIPLH